MEIIVLIIIVSILAIILFFALKKLIASINEDSKDYYLKNIEVYNKEILEKSEKLKELDNNPYDKEIKKEDKEDKVIVDVDHDFIKIMNETEYETSNALKEANKVDEIFNIDEDKIVKDFVKNLEVNPDCEIYQSLYDRFSPNLIYKLKMLNKSSQIKEIIKMIPDKELEVFNSYLETHKFKLEKFLLDLDLLIERNLPRIEVLVGNKNKNFDNYSPYIKTIYSPDIYKGIIIKYQDLIYDYSINERDV